VIVAVIVILRRGLARPLIVTMKPGPDFYLNHHHKPNEEVFS